MLIALTALLLKYFDLDRGLIKDVTYPVNLHSSTVTVHFVESLLSRELIQIKENSHFPANSILCYPIYENFSRVCDFVYGFQAVPSFRGGFIDPQSGSVLLTKYDKGIKGLESMLKHQYVDSFPNIKSKCSDVKWQFSNADLDRLRYCTLLMNELSYKSFNNKLPAFLLRSLYLLDKIYRYKI